MSPRIITCIVAVCFLTCLAATAADNASARAISLDSLDLTTARTGWGEVRANKAVDGNALSIGGRKFATGIGMHAEGGIHLALDGQASLFRAFVGVDDEVAPKVGSVEFSVTADGREIWKSGIMKTGDAAKEISLPLQGVRSLQLLVGDGGDGINNDHADWAEATVVATPGSVKPFKGETTKRFSQPGRIRYDGHCFQIEGKDTFIYSATFQYFRTPRELWRDRFQKIKEAGFNAVETYTPWNWHERQMPAGPDDFSKLDLSELEAWLKMAQDEFGLYTIVRPGPFICAEWAGGGYPRWLAKFGPGTGGFWLRGSDDTHIAWSVHWYDAVCKLFAREQLTRKPVGGKGIIMVQIENEYDAHGTGGKAKFLRALYDAVQRAGVEVPVFTCLTGECRNSLDPKLSQVFDCDNYYVGLTEAPGCAHRMASLRAKQPNAPGIVTELQGGWFSTIGSALSEDHYSDSRHSNAIHWMSLLGGAGGLVPYVFVGGTHFGNWGSRGQTTTYDYNAGIREWGARGAKYAVAQGVARFIRDNEVQLLRAEGGPCEIKGAPKSLFGGVRVAPDGTRFVFLLNNDPNQPATGKATLVPGQIAKPSAPIYNIDQNGNRVLIQTGDAAAGKLTLAPFEVAYDLPPLGAGALVIPPGKTPAEGVWYPKPQQAISRPATLPAPVRIVGALRRDEDFAAKWQPLPVGKSLSELGVGDQRYTLYRSHVRLTGAEAASLTKLLVNSFSRDIVTVQINGKLPKRTHPSDAYAASAHRNMDTSWKRIGPDDFDNRFDATGLLKAGTNEITFLYEDIGHEHGYVPMEELCGIRAAGLGDTEKKITKPFSLKVATDLGGIVNGWNLPAFSTVGWQRIKLDTAVAIPRKGNGIQPKAAPDALLSWYRMEFELPAADPKVFMPWALRINASGNGEMYLNGHNIGRHFEAGPQREYYLPECWLNFGPGRKNILTLGLRQTIHGAIIRRAEIAPYPDAAEIRN
jgi:hypothetical protein